VITNCTSGESTLLATLWFASTNRKTDLAIQNELIERWNDLVIRRQLTIEIDSV
jgi:hypothetical protein